MMTEFLIELFSIQESKAEQVSGIESAATAKFPKNPDITSDGGTMYKVNVDVHYNSRKTAINILHENLGIIPIEITRFTNGYCHSVYYVKTAKDEFVLRITGKTNKQYYTGSLKWLTELNALGIPVPQIIKHGQYQEEFYALISFIPGKDMGEVYRTLTDSQKRGIVKELSAIQRKVSALPVARLYGYPHSGRNESFTAWTGYVESILERARERIKQNGIFSADVCETVKESMRSLDGYFSSVKPTPFLDDITTKNVLIHDGKLSGIVDVDEMCFGDPLLVIGLTHAALLLMEADTKYTEYWLDETGADAIQRKAVTCYTLLFCTDFMGEQGTRFDNGTIVPCNQKIIEILHYNYNDLLKRLS